MFLFTVCQVGAESALKKEVAKNAPSLRFAYSRPGFLTFKNADEKDLPADFELKSIFARAYGLSIGKATRPSDALDAAGKLFARNAARNSGFISGSATHHVFGEEPKDFAPGRVSAEARTRAQKVRGFFQTLSRSRTRRTRRPGPGSDLSRSGLLVDRISSAHVPALALCRRKASDRAPQKAPSRAYLKLEESVLWSGAPLEKGDTAIEIGSAPGGASYALLERGLNVIGIDPADMDKAVLSFGSGRFKHLAKPAAQVQIQGSSARTCNGSCST